MSQRFCAGTPPSPSFLVAARHRRGPALPAFRERLGHVAATALPCARACAPSSLSPKAELLLVHSLTHHRAGPELHGCRAMAMPWRADTHTCALPRPKAWPMLLTSTSPPLNTTKPGLPVVCTRALAKDRAFLPPSHTDACPSARRSDLAL